MIKMPRYVYYCNSCEQVFEQSHSIKIRLEDCHLCSGQDCLKRLPSTTRVMKYNKNNDKKVGQVVKQHIEETRREIKKDKEEAMREWK